MPFLNKEFRREIGHMHGREINLIIQKKLYGTDLSRHYNRLAIPFSQIINGDFLTEEENATLESQDFIEAVPLLIKPAVREPGEPVMEVININLSQWKAKKISSYMLGTSWKQVVGMNELEERDVVQLWSFRVAQTLHLALVVVGRANEQQRLN